MRVSMILWHCLLSFPLLTLSEMVSPPSDRLDEVHGQLMDMLEDNISKAGGVSSQHWAKDGEFLDAELADAMAAEDKRLSSFSDSSKAVMQKSMDSFSGQLVSPDDQAKKLRDELKNEWIRIHQDGSERLSKRLVGNGAISNFFRGFHSVRSVDESVALLFQKWRQKQFQNIQLLKEKSRNQRAHIEEFLGEGPVGLDRSSKQFLDAQSSYLKLLQVELKATKSFTSFKSKVLAAEGQSRWEISRLKRRVKRTKDSDTKDLLLKAIKMHNEKIKGIEDSVAAARLQYDTLIRTLGEENAALTKKLKSMDISFDAIKVADLRVKLNAAQSRSIEFDANMKKMEKKFTPGRFRQTLMSPYFKAGMGTFTFIALVGLLALLFT